MNISRQPNGKWRVIVQDEGRRRSKVCATEREAKRAGAMLMLELGKQPDPSGQTLDDLIDLHIAQSELAITTLADYAIAMRKMPQWMKDWRVENVTTMMVDQAYRRLLDEGWSVHRVRRVHEIMSPAFDRAARWGWIPHNPVSSARQPSKPDVEMIVPSPAEVMAILDAADKVNPSLGCALDLAAHTGVRRGELCALQWGDLREQAAEIVIRRSVSTTTADPHRVTSGKTGKGGHRVIPLAPSSMRALKAHKARQNTFLLEKGIDASRQKWIFTHDGARPWRTDYVTLAFSRIRDELGSDTHLHLFRHFAATQWITQGYDIRTVSYLLGHAKTSTTLDVYSAFMPARGREATDHLANVLRRG